MGLRSRRGDNGSEPFIPVSRGDEFADSLETSFFPMTFPTLSLFGVGEQGWSKRQPLSAESEQVHQILADSGYDRGLETW